MICCNLKGGLGNILFQIATAKSLSIDKNVDCSFPNLTPQLNLINSDNYYNPKIKHSFEYKIMLRNLDFSQPNFNGPTFSYPWTFIELDLPKDNFFIDGFFQSEKYFAHNRKQILKYLEIPESISEIIDSKYGDLLKQKTTSIHVRRGDYVYHPNHHPVQTIEYYNQGVEYLKNDTEIFLIFSDDIPWCRENLKYENCVYISDEKDYIEMYLMSLCDNNITCNSSFSWWGAWLNKNENKKVIGPTKWFGPAITHDTSDILPDKWIKI
jgi:hypothetical protein